MVSECDGLWSEGNEDEIEELRSSDYVMCCKAITEQLITYLFIGLHRAISLFLMSTGGTLDHVWVP